LTKDTTKEKEKTILYVYYRFPKGIYIYILYQKYVINGKKLQYFGYGAKCCCFYFSFL